ncbi:hypothetical protein KOXY103107_09705 [Komagataeibacter xylinus]
MPSPIVASSTSPPASAQAPPSRQKSDRPAKRQCCWKIRNGHPATPSPAMPSTCTPACHTPPDTGAGYPHAQPARLAASPPRTVSSMQFSAIVRVMRRHSARECALEDCVAITPFL